MKFPEKTMKRNVFHSAGMVFLVCFFSFFFSHFAEGNENAEHYENLFRMANDAYSRGQYDSALAGYQAILNADFESSSLYFNIGNAFYKTKKIPSAILYYEKARKLQPNDNDVAFNLLLANQQITDKIEPLPELFFIRWWNGVVSSASMDSWARYAIIFCFYTFSMFVFFVFSVSGSFRKLFFWSGIAGVFMAILSFSFALKQESNILGEKEAIVFAPSVTTKSSPDESSTNLFLIHEGTKVKILEKLNDWCKISLLDGNIGWIKEGQIRHI